MNYGDWLSKQDINNKWSELKVFVSSIIIFVIIPLVIYSFIKGDPIISYDYAGGPIRPGFFAVFGIYYYFLHLLYKAREIKQKTIKHLDILMSIILSVEQISIECSQEVVKTIFTFEEWEKWDIKEFLKKYDQISPHFAKKLIKVIGCFERGILELNGLTVITSDAARELASFEGSTLALNGLNCINVEIIKELTSFNKSFVYLYGLKTITPEVAKEISKYINIDTAKNLDKRGRAGLQLNGVETIDIEIAKELSKFKKGVCVSTDIQKRIKDMK